MKTCGKKLCSSWKILCRNFVCTNKSVILCVGESSEVVIAGKIRYGDGVLILFMNLTKNGNSINEFGQYSGCTGLPMQ